MLPELEVAATGCCACNSPCVLTRSPRSSLPPPLMCGLVCDLVCGLVCDFVCDFVYGQPPPSSSFLDRIPTC